MLPKELRQARNGRSIRKIFYARQKRVELFFQNNASSFDETNTLASTVLCSCTPDDVDIFYIEDNGKPKKSFISSDIALGKHFIVETINALTSRTEPWENNLLQNNEVK